MMNMFSAKKTKTIVDDVTKGDHFSQSALSSVYGWFVKQMHEIFPQTSTTDILEKYPHPVMVVIGCESTGKSATIENITKVPMFPTASGICTRCPIHVVMIPIDENQEIRYTLTYTAPFKQCLEFFTEANCQQIKTQVAAIFDEIVKHSSPTTNAGYDKNEITITVYRPNIIRMDFVDLPGIVSYPPAARDFTLDLSTSYINDPNSFILCVANATTPRLTSYEPLARIISVAACHRTILVLPMADKLSPNDIYAQLYERVLLKSDEFQGHTFSACCSVVNRSNASEITLQDQQALETSWFDLNVLQPVQANIAERKGNKKEEAAMKAMSKDLAVLKTRLGIENLIHVANDKFERYIETNWMPRTIVDIQATMATVQAELHQLGDIPDATNFPLFQKEWETMVSQMSVSIWSDSVLQAELFQARVCALPLEEMTAEKVWVTTILSFLERNELYLPAVPDGLKRAHRVITGRAMPGGGRVNHMHRFRDPLVNAVRAFVTDFMGKRVYPTFEVLFPGSVLPILLGQGGSLTFTYLIQKVHKELTQGVRDLFTLELLVEDDGTAVLRKGLLEKWSRHDKVLKLMEKKVAKAIVV